MGHLTPSEAAEFVRRHGTVVRAFVETGTHRGTTLYPILASGLFERLHSVELSTELHARAAERLLEIGSELASAGTRVTLHCGDSAAVLPRLAQELDEPALFWLDAHWFDDPDAASSAPCPIFGELDAVRARPHADVVVVDDAQCFGQRWSSGPGGDWTAVHADSILDRLGRDRVADHYLTNCKLVVHLRRRE